MNSSSTCYHNADYGPNPVDYIWRTNCSGGYEQQPRDYNYENQYGYSYRPQEEELTRHRFYFPKNFIIIPYISGSFLLTPVY